MQGTTGQGDGTGKLLLFHGPENAGAGIPQPVGCGTACLDAKPFPGADAAERTPDWSCQPCLSDYRPAPRA